MAEHDIRVDINLTVQGGEGGTESALEPTQQKADVSAKAAVNNARNNPSKLVATYAATQAIKFATSNYGTLTGDYIGQSRITDAITFGGMAAAVAKSPIMGTAAVLVGTGIKAAQYAIDLQKQKQEAQILLARVGRVVSSGGR